MHLSPPDSERQRQIHALLDDYLALCATDDDPYGAHFSGQTSQSSQSSHCFGKSFSGYTGCADAPVTDWREWLQIIQKNVFPAPQRWPFERQHLSLQDIGGDAVLATALWHADGLSKDAPSPSASVRLVLICRIDGGVWKIVYNGLFHLIPNTLPTKPQIDALQHLTQQNQTLQTQLKDLIEVVNQKEVLYRQLTDDIRDVLWQTDSELHITYISPADERLRGFSAQEMLGRHVFEIFTDEGIALVQQKMQARAIAESNGTRTGSSLFEVQLRCKNGDLLWGEVLAKPHRSADGTVIGYHGITREITERKLLQDRVHDLAFYDPLTQLANRRLLIDHLTQTQLSYQRQHNHGALLFLDLDNFKSLNDTHGHGAGDLLLIEVARRLKACVRLVDTVARFGGDEFVVLLSTLSSDHGKAALQASALAEKIRASLAQPYHITVTLTEQPSTTVVEHHGTASIGVVLFDGCHTNPHEIIDRADTAMYQAKEGGRNRVCFDTSPALKPLMQPRR
jgi:diguanylate cyclase (GGDEF)-like protein/PAS domain S-box-containing protein